VRQSDVLVRARKVDEQKNLSAIAASARNY